MELPLAGGNSTGSITVAPSSLNETRGKVLLSVAPFCNMEFFAIEVPEVVLRRSWWVDEPGRQAGGVGGATTVLLLVLSKGRQDIERMRSHHQL